MPFNHDSTRNLISCSEGSNVLSGINLFISSLSFLFEILPDLILLDWMIPKMSGPDVCRKIRKSQDIKETPIIMISAKSEEQDKIFGLDLGVDDYISKPYSIKELLARVRAAIRSPIALAADDKLQVGSIVMNLKSYKVMINAIDIHLGPTE